MSYADLEAKKEYALASWQHGGMSYNRYLEIVKEANDEEERRDKEKARIAEEEKKRKEEAERAKPKTITPTGFSSPKTTCFSDLDRDDISLSGAEFLISTIGVPGVTLFALGIDYLKNAEKTTSDAGIAQLLCIGAWALGCFSYGLSLADKEKAEYGSTKTSDKIERGVLNTVHLSAFLALAYVTANSAMYGMNNAASFEKEALFVAGSCCAYQLAAIGLKTLKLHTR